MSDKIITCVYCGQEYPANTPTWGKDVSVLTSHIKTCPEHPMRKVEAELAELQATFDLRWKADQRAIKMWQKAHPDKKNVWPDHADLVVWLMEQLETAEKDTEFYRCKLPTTAQAMVEISAKLRQEKLEQFLKDFLKWRNGPEGPEVLFAEGAALVEEAKRLSN